VLRVYDCVAHLHDLRLVAVAALIAILGSHTAISLLRHVSVVDFKRLHWLFAAAMAGGCAIWGAHFVAILAYDPLVEDGYEIGLTAMSLLEAIALTGCGLALALLSKGWTGQVIGGAVVGGGIAIMHYTGMEAVEFPGNFAWDGGMVGASVALGCALASAGVTVAVRCKAQWTRPVATVLLTLAICATHFIGIAATTIHLRSHTPVTDSLISPGMLAVGAAVICGVIVLLGFAAVALDRRAARRREAENTNLRNLADIAFEGLVICDGDVVVATNKSFERMIECSSDSLVGADVQELFAVGQPAGGVTIALENVEEKMLRARSGAYIPVEVLRKPIAYAGRQHQVMAVRDLRERRKADAEIRHLAHHDQLTGLYNRASFGSGLAGRLAEPQSGRPFALLALDLDHFKSVNDTYGHPTGDALLQIVADRLRSSLRATDIIGRLGGDEFAIVLAGPLTPRSVSDTAERLVGMISEPYIINDNTIQIGVSIGITMAPSSIENAEALMKSADVALYQAKASGRSMSCFFKADMVPAGGV
jgi:diguanylate cyclase (GGDEF)-like protein